MNINQKFFFLVLFFVLILSSSCVCAEEINEINSTSINQYSLVETDNSDIVGAMNSQNELLSDESDEIVVNDWDELQYYCSLTDRDYTLKLKENTNFYPTNPTDSNCQIKINNNVKIIGSVDSYIGDSSFHQCYIPSDGNHYVLEGGQFVTYNPIVVPDNNRKSLTLENITFKWIYCKYSPDALFMKLGGGGNYIIKDCSFVGITNVLGDGNIIRLQKGKATLDNCSFINCSVPKGIIDIYGQQSMIVNNCYFENNFAYEHTTCIKNYGNLKVFNTKFYKNRSAAWAGGITTYDQGVTDIYNSNFTGNVAGWNGGALYCYNIMNIYNSTFVDNNCTTNNGGGAIGACQFVGIPRIYIENSLFKDNNNLCWALDSLSTTGTGRGGAISFMDKGSIEVRNSLFISNSASIGTAICAWEAGSYGSPDIYIINNTFINHTRAGDVLNVKVIGTVCNVSGNHYIGNSIEFSNLTLTPLNTGNEQATFKINVKLSNPDYYEDDILDRTFYDVYINNKYSKTVNSTVFTIDFGDLDICNVYVVPTISNSKSNEVTVASTREYIFVSKNGSDNNKGSSRSSPVNTINKALELAKDCRNIILLDGNWSENLKIDCDVLIKGENNATLTNTAQFVLNSNFTLKNMNVINLSVDNFIRQNSGNLIVENCIFKNNAAVNLIDARHAEISKSIIINNNATLINNNGYASITNSVILNNTDILKGNQNYVLDYNWWGSTLKNPAKPVNLNISNWLVLNATSSVNRLEQNQVALISLGFYLNNASKYTNLPEIEFTYNALNGNLDSRLAYTLTALKDGVVTVNYNDVYYDIIFEFLKSNPNLQVKTENVMFGEDVVIQISMPSDASGNVTVEISNLTQTMKASKDMIFTFKNLKADNYVVNAVFSGDDKYLPQNATSNVQVSRYPSKTDLEISEIKVNEDVLISVSCLSDAQGNVTLYINNKAHTLALTNAKTTYTIKNITRGDYIIKAVYNGDDKYLESQSSTKIEVDNLNASMLIEAADIIYGESAVIIVRLNDNATGNVTVTVDGKSNSSGVVDGQSVIILSGLEAGDNKNITVFYTGDDTYFNKTGATEFTISKADLTFDISADNIKIGQDAVIHINVPAKTSGTFTIGGDVITIPLSGAVEYVISDLAIGEYEITAIYDGNNYNTVQNSTTFAVLEYPISQWPNEGLDSKSSYKSQYGSDTNGEIAFIIDLEEDIVGALTIDSDGNIYVTTQNGIYSYDANGSLRFVFTPDTREGNFSGTCIGRDVVISPKSGDTLYFINQTTGEKYGSSNLYQGSSIFAPIIDSNANVYIVSEYQVTSGRYNLVKIPYRMWEFGGNPILVDLAKTAPLCSPTVNENIVVVLSENRLRVLDANTLQFIFIKSGNYANVCPVIGEGNIVYAALSDSVVAYSMSGSQLWKSKITSGVRQLLLDEDVLYSLNADGKLYRYDVLTGKQGLVSNLNITSGVLIGNDSNLYFASNNIFYMVSGDGEILWKSDLSTKITGNPVMDKNGVIYVSSFDNRIFALTCGDLKDPNLTVSVDDSYIIISVDSQAAGSVSFDFNNVSYENVFNISISDLAEGNYQINVTYSGDLRFRQTSEIVTFTVKPEVVPEIESNIKDTVSITLCKDAIGNLTVIVGNYTCTLELVNGKVAITVPGLDSMGDVTVIYSGDSKYSGFNKTTNVALVKSKLTANNLNMLYSSGKYFKVRLTQNSNPMGGKTVVFTVNGKKITRVTDADGYALVKITLAPKTYSVTAEYNGVKVKNKVVVKSIIQAKNVNAKKSSKSIKIKVTIKKVNGKYLKNKKITLKFNKKTLKAKTNKKGVATFTIKNSVYKKLKTNKKYTYQVIYGKDKVKKTIKFKK
ncbi:Ig-like domain repeat protein [uncultured Methanobrevibacter sp.]|uniref:Ig-like domain repeat protein n=1 Tax=uncultured Methanobrevibacter sp. TaxID=253161 RepID=UPI0025DE44AC|nr:Ig-like domain repeat protein [uncultured Methanobrevibacter sp.]